nr:EpsG family protein [uncultured Blautia sp.]
MSEYILILLWVGIAGIMACTGCFDRVEEVNGRNVWRLNPVYAFLVLLPLAVWRIRGVYLGDTYTYINSYFGMPENFSGISEYMSMVTKDRAFYLFGCLLRIFWKDKVGWYLATITFVQICLLTKVYRRYSDRFMISIFLFIASADYISWIFNGVRQFLAVTIVFACFNMILKKRYIPVIIILLLASQFHGSALIVAPFVFICQGKAWNKRTILFLAGVVFAVVFVGKFTDILDFMLTETQYTNVVSDWHDFNDDGTNMLRVLVYSVPAIISWFGRKQIQDQDNPIINLCTNMSIVAAGMYIVSAFTSGIFIGRLPIYFSLYSYILLPWEIDNLFSESVRKLIYCIMVGCYLVFYYYQMHVIYMVF